MSMVITTTCRKKIVNLLNKREQFVFLDEETGNVCNYALTLKICKECCFDRRKKCCNNLELQKEV